MELQLCVVRILSRSHHSSLMLVFSLLIATALAFVSHTALAQFGVLDESKEIVKGSTPPKSTDPGKSFTIDSRNVIAEPTTTDKSEDMSRKSTRLRETETRVNIDRRNVTGRVVNLFSKNGLGRIEKNLTEAQVSDRNIINDFLEDNDAIFEGLHELAFQVDEVVSGGVRIVFRQLIGDTPLESASHLDMDESGNVISLNIITANPDNPEFAPRSWLSEQVLMDLAEKVWIDRSMPDPFSPHQKGFVISFDLNDGTHVPVYRVSVGAYQIMIHAVTGDTIRFMDIISYEKRCTKTLSGIPPFVGSDCTQKNGSNQSWYLTFWDSGCVEDSPFCENEKYNEVAGEILNLRTWINARSSVQLGPGYDLRLNTILSTQQSAGGWFHVRFPARPVISIGQWTTTDPELGGPQAYVRKDVSGHEAGHMWHNRAGPH